MRLSVYANFHIFVYTIILHVYIFGFLDRRKCNRGSSTAAADTGQKKKSVTCTDGARELAMAVVNNGSRSQASKMFDLAMNLDEQVGHMMNELEQVQDTLAKLVALYPESLSYADLDDAD